MERDKEPIFKKEQKVWVFGEDKGIVVKETDPRIFLVKIEDTGMTLEVGYSELLPREEK